MVKQTVKNIKKTAKTVKASAKVVEKEIKVKNAEGEVDTTATILVQNSIKYTPKVSVIIPVYNVEEYLRECLDSIVNQTLKEIEIICVDDGSTDSSLEILKEYAKKDNRITVISQKNLHAGVARNAGLSVAKGEYLSFLDSDDFFELNMLEEMYNKAKKTSAEICICHVKMYNMSSKVKENCSWGLRDEFLPKQDVFSAKQIYKDLYRVNQGWVWDKIYNKKFLQKNKIRFQSQRTSNDVFFSFCNLSLAEKITVVPDFLLTHRLHVKGSLENSREKSYLNIYNAVTKIKSFLEKQGLYNKVKISFVNFAISNIMWNYETLPEPSKTFLLDVINKFYKSLFHSIKKEDFYRQEIYDNFNAVLDKKYMESPEKYIPVVFATNTNYALQCLVAIKSLIENASKNRKYAVFVMHSELSDYYIQEIEKLGTDNVFVHCINVNVSKLVGNSFNYTTAHFSKEMYYRILISQLFWIYDKVVYLDCDIIVTKDIYDLYKVNIGTNILGAVVNPVKNTKDYVENNLHVDFDKYFNSGVLIINTKAFRESGIKEKCLDLLQTYKSLRYPDQDILNMACQGKVYYLDVRWNYQWFVRFLNIELPDYCKESFKKAADDFYIIHYASDKKPWNLPGLQYAGLWWKYAIGTIASEHFMGKLNIKQALCDWFFSVKQQNLNIDSPKTYNEKLQWLKIYDATPLKTLLADKHLVRDWVADKIGKKYLVPIYGTYDSFDEIDFDKLPKQFVIKTNHGSGWNIIVKDKSKLDLAYVKEKLNFWMGQNFAFKYGFELHYRDIKPKIIIEKYIDQSESDHEIQVWCFNGKIKFVSVESVKDKQDLVRGTFYPDGKPTEFAISPNHYKKLDKITDKQAFDEALALANKMLIDVPYVRIDFIEWHGSVLFREMTFTSGSGLSVIEPDIYNKILGKWIKLPSRAYNLDTGEYYKLPKVKVPVKPYLFFPLYGLANIWMKVVSLPLAKFKRHVKRVLYSHSTRGKIEELENRMLRQMYVNHKAVLDNQEVQFRKLSDSVDENTEKALEKIGENNKNLTLLKKGACENHIMIGVVMTTDTDLKRFSAMKQLFDVGMKILENPQYVVTSKDFTDADKGIVCVYPFGTSNINADSLRVLYQKNEHEKAPTMSIMKLMTIATGMPYISSICNERVTLQPQDIYGGSGNFFKAGDVLTVEDLLYGILLPSSNTCAVAFARYVGSKKLNKADASFEDCLNAFKAELKRRANIIGCQDSNFISVSGLDTNNYSTPSDMLKVLLECTKYPEIMNIWNKKAYTVYVNGENTREVVLQTTVQNASLERDYYIIGGKTGTANKGDLRSLVMIAKPIPKI